MLFDICSAQIESVRKVWVDMRQSSGQLHKHFQRKQRDVAFADHSKTN